LCSLPSCRRPFSYPYKTAGKNTIFLYVYTGNECLHEVNNANGVRGVNVATSKCQEYNVPTSQNPLTLLGHFMMERYIIISTVFLYKNDIKLFLMSIFSGEITIMPIAVCLLGN
jgi:hypothetical protein